LLKELSPQHRKQIIDSMLKAGRADTKENILKNKSKIKVVLAIISHHPAKIRVYKYF
jgi:hypothetical protein